MHWERDRRLFWLWSVCHWIFHSMKRVKTNKCMMLSCTNDYFIFKKITSGLSELFSGFLNFAPTDSFLKMSNESIGRLTIVVHQKCTNRIENLTTTAKRMSWKFRIGQLKNVNNTMRTIIITSKTTNSWKNEQWFLVIHETQITDDQSLDTNKSSLNFLSYEIIMLFSEIFFFRKIYGSNE